MPLLHSQGWTLLDASKIQKGIWTARSDDTKSPKGVVLDWITPQDITLNPSLSHNIKTNHGFHHPVMGSLLCPASLDWNDSGFVSVMSFYSYLSHPYWSVRGKLSSGEMLVHGDQWPMLLFANQEYDPDDPWEGLFRSQLLVWVKYTYISLFSQAQCCVCRHLSISSLHPVQ